jgi:hypothetical protein
MCISVKQTGFWHTVHNCSLKAVVMGAFNCHNYMKDLTLALWMAEALVWTVQARGKEVKLSREITREWPRTFSYLLQC